jgi:hypothetical protein
VTELRKAAGLPELAAAEGGSAFTEGADAESAESAGGELRRSHPAQRFVYDAVTALKRARAVFRECSGTTCRGIRRAMTSCRRC